MHSALVRTQNVFGFFTTVAFCTALLTAFSVLLSPQHPFASLEVRNVQVYVIMFALAFFMNANTDHVHSVKGRPHYYSPKKEEYANIKFDLSAGSSLLPMCTTLLHRSWHS